ncbi:MAG TPA: helix-turn-helix domain-containing protein [Leptospiraceae bacterium]|nr:helix-turn-helix domain-containing protein [Leptospiraceae bacterium]HNL02146.1 helix-turn-helix domain-containing protein [Leptospiraceae bacterium]HNN76690.1 helix-turn-helix domain-containing protein [Leptospiraceae bacterium]
MRSVSDAAKWEAIASMLTRRATLPACYFTFPLLTTTPESYNGRYRVAEAERLMKAHPEKTLIEIAFESGFNSKTSFHGGFKKLRGVAPSKFGR